MTCTRASIYPRVEILSLPQRTEHDRILKCSPGVLRNRSREAEFGRLARNQVGDSIVALISSSTRDTRVEPRRLGLARIFLHAVLPRSPDKPWQRDESGAREARSESNRGFHCRTRQQNERDENRVEKASDLLVLLPMSSCKPWKRDENGAREARSESSR